MPRIYSRRMHIVTHAKVGMPSAKALHQMTPEERAKLVKMPALQFQQRRFPWEPKPEGTRA